MNYGFCYTNREYKFINQDYLGSVTNEFYLKKNINYRCSLDNSKYSKDIIQQ
jgi:hypothetical protein